MAPNSSLIKAIVIVFIPLLACLTYYTSQRLGAENSVLYIPALIALPLLLIGVTGGITLVISGKGKIKYKKLLFTLSLLTSLSSGIFLAYIWL